MIQITQITTKLVKNPNTKTTYNEVSKEIKIIDLAQVKRIKDSCSFFKRLGGRETITNAYTANGYCMVKLISVSPDKQDKTIREFQYKFIEA